MRLADRLKLHAAARAPVADPEPSPRPKPSGRPTSGLPSLADRLATALGFSEADADRANDPGYDARDVRLAPGCDAALPASVTLLVPALAELRRSLAVVTGDDVTGPLAVLDLETTGLGTVGGTAIPAVVGLTVAQTDVCVSQWVLRRGGAEGGLLRDVATRLRRLAESGGTLLSFNGASFDRPLLTARMRRFGITVPWPRHFDLLTVARRLWGHEGDCRLTSLEARRLGIVRRGDLSGAAVADVLVAALQRPDAATLRVQVDRVLDHNQVDLLTPLALLPAMAAAIDRPRGGAQARGVARHLLARGEADRARRVLERALAAYTSLRELAAQNLALQCADLRRRAGDRAGAAALWAWICAEAPGHPEAHEGLAKHLEHRRRDPAAALAVARASALPCPHRLARLHRKASGRTIPAWEHVIGRWAPAAKSAPV